MTGHESAAGPGKVAVGWLAGGWGSRACVSVFQKRRRFGVSWTQRSPAGARYFHVRSHPYNQLSSTHDRHCSCHTSATDKNIL